VGHLTDTFDTPTLDIPTVDVLGNKRAHAASMSTPISKANALEKRLIVFATKILTLSSKLPRTLQARHISNQILRSGTAAAANYGEARGAESRADFVHKLRVVFKEVNETTIWLELLVQSSMISGDFATSILAENRELCRIIAASIKTACRSDE
jgi:four helix bundle protein